MTDKQKILIVDDKKENLLALRKALCKIDAEFIEASNGNEALAATLHHNFAVALLDVQMPGMTGYELAEHLRGDERTQVIPIVFLTASYDDDVHMFKGYEVGAVDYIMKPFLPEMLEGKVKALLEISFYRQALEKSEKKYRNLIEATRTGFVILDGQGRVLDANAEYVRLSGHRELAEILGRNVIEWITAHSLEKSKLALTSCSQGGIVHGLEIDHVGVDGKIIPVEINATVEGTGDDLRIMSLCRDITERKQIEEVQNFLAQTSIGTKEEPFFNALALYLAQNLCMDFVCIDRLEGDGLTARTVAVWCDGHFEDNVTYALKDTPCGDVVGKTVCCFPANVCQFFPRDQVLLNLRAESYIGVTLFDHAGQPIGLIAVIGRSPLANRSLAENTLKMVSMRVAGELERLEAAETLRASEKRYAMTLAAVNDGIWDWHVPSGNAFFSTMFYTLLGFDDGEFPATYASWRLLVNPDDIARVEYDIKKSVETGMGFAIDLRMKKKTGDWLWVSTRGKTIELDADGKALRMVGTLSNITERKRMEDEKAKLEEQNRHLQKTESLGLMSGSIAHIFNNQLQIVMGYLEMVIGELPPNDSIASKLEKSMQAAKKASEVSGNLLAYLGQKQVKLELFDLAGLCRMSMPVLQEEKPENVSLETCLPSPGPCISADVKQIKQILNNLVINAWESIGDGYGTIHLSVRTVSSADIQKSHRFPLEWQSREQLYACLEVNDSGCGIREEDMDKIFDPFFSTKFTGRGLGLSVVLGYVRMHNAVITTESRINGGSVFKIFFPLSAQMPTRQNEPIAKTPKIVQGGTVLLVEDEKALREMIRFALTGFGFTVLQAKDGIEAVEIFEKHKDEISCLLSDLTMPRMGGWETIAALRAIRHDLPVILASGYNEDSVMAGKHSELPDFFLNKPYDLHKLADAIGQAIARKQGGG